MILLLGCALYTESIAQEYSFAHYDVKEGLPSSVVYAAVQDKEGFMWFATEGGLSRFDGIHYKNFTIQDGLPDNEIIGLFVDSKNRIWIIPFKNTICYYYQGKIHTPQNDSVLNSVKINTLVSSIVEDRHGNILIIESNTMYAILPSSKVKKWNKIFGSNFYGLNVSLNNGGNLEAAVHIMNPGYPGITIVEGMPDEPRLAQSYEKGLINSANSIVSALGLRIYESENQIIYEKPGSRGSLPLPGNFISVNLLQDSNICLNTATGSYIYDYNGQLIDLFLKNKIVNKAYSDDEGDWWFCTQGEGVFRLISSGVKIFSFKQDEASFPVYSIAKFDSSIYLGTDRYRIAILNGDRYQVKKIYAGYLSGRVRAMAKSNAQNIIYGTDDAIILGKPERILTPRDLRISVKAMQLKGNELLTATHIGILRLDLSERKKPDTLWHYRATSVCELDNSVYFGNLNGLYRILEKSGARSVEEISSLSDTKISALAASRDSILWVATFGKGLFGIKDGKVQHVLTTDSGLCSNTCRCLFIQDDVVWVGTDRGVSKVSLDAKGVSILNFSTADGLASDIINAIYSDENTVYIGTAEGVTRLDQTRISQNSTCRLRITGIQAGSSKYYHDTTNLLLPHFYNQFNVEYSGISFKSAGDVVYYYRLIGLNNDWQTTRTNFISYPTLPSGAYRLELYAVNKYGVKSNDLSLSFEVKQLLWETWWFKLAAGLLILAGIWTFIALRIKWLKRKEKAESLIKERIYELEQMALKAQMNPHFIFNCLNSIQQYVMERDFTGVNTFISDFASLIRKTLESSSKKEISLEEELEYISTYLRLEKSRLEDKFNFQIHIDDEIIPSEYYLPPMILQPCLENSIRHGIRYRPDNFGEINVFIRKDDAYLACIIEDNGVGRKIAQKYKGVSHIEYQSKGMQLTMNRIEMLSLTSERKARVEWEDIINGKGKVEGTRVTIQFPLEKISKM